MPRSSYGRRNRQAITDREIRITTRLDAIEHAYQIAIELDATTVPTKPAEPRDPADYVADREIELG